MKIYERVTIEIFSGAVLEEHSYEYSGQIAYAKGTPDVPPVDPLEQELRQLNIDAIRRSAQLEEDLEPFVLQNMRLIRDEESGELRRMTDEEFILGLSPSEKIAHENLLLRQERQSRALRGELPLTEAGQVKKGEEFAAFKERMARAGNPITGDTPETATATTTAGVQGLKAFNERFGLLEQAERTGELTTGASAILQRIGVTSDIGARERAGLLAFPQGPLGRARVATSSQQPFQFDRGLGFQANVIGSRNQQEFLAGLLEFGGTVGGAAIGGGFFSGGGGGSIDPAFFPLPLD